MLRDCLIGGHVRLSEFADTRATVAWASTGDPAHVVVEPFSLNPGSPTGKQTRVQVSTEWALKPLGKGIPQSWSSMVRAARLLELVGERRQRGRVWCPFISVPVYLLQHVVGVLAAEVRVERMKADVLAMESGQPSSEIETPACGGQAVSSSYGVDDFGWQSDRSDPFMVLHAVAAAAAYIRLWQQGERGPQYARALVESFERFRHTRGARSDAVTSNSLRSMTAHGKVFDPEEVYDYGRGLGLFAPRSSIVQVVNATPELIKLLRRNPENLRQLTPEAFEHLVADRLDRMGFDVALTGGVNTCDGGIDIIATPKQRNAASFLLAAQVKHHSTGQPATRADVDRLLAWKDSVFRLGLIVTNTRFTASARWVAERNTNRAFLRLREFADLKRWLYDNFSDNEDWSEIPTSIELAPGIVVQVPKLYLPTRKDHDGDDETG